MSRPPPPPDLRDDGLLRQVREIEGNKVLEPAVLYARVGRGGMGAVYPSFPSEAQWEYACRARTQTAFSFGDAMTPSQAHYYASRSFPGGDTAAGATPSRLAAVDSFAPNGFGLHSLHGNVAEWCLDFYDAALYGKPAARQRNPVATEQTERHVQRGGSFASAPAHCRSASRREDIVAEILIDKGKDGLRAARPLSGAELEAVRTYFNADR